MVNCRIPNCPSTQRKKEKDISFHEIPTREPTRSEWLKQIAIKDWQPSGRSVICSRHFLKSDFVPDAKRKKLVAGAIPSIFPTNSSYVQPKSKMIHKPPKNKEIIVQRKPLSDTTSYRNKLGEPKKEKSNTNYESTPHICTTDVMEQPMEYTNEPSAEKSNTPIIVDKTPKINLPKSGRPQISILNLRRKYKNLKAQNYKLMKRNKQLKLKIQKLTNKLIKDDKNQSAIHTTIKQIIDDANSNDTKAIFLLNQINAYKKN